MQPTWTTTTLFEDLPFLDGTRERSAWSIFGAAFEQGSLNRITPDVTKSAANLITDGRTVNLSLPVDHSVGLLDPSRGVVTHTRLTFDLGHDDILGNYYPQSSSHWDGLAHIRYGRHGYFGGTEEIDLDKGVLGIDRLAPNGIATRGVLIDIASSRSRRGTPLDTTKRIAIEPEELNSVLEEQGTVLRSGDVVIIRTGWTEWYSDLDVAQRAALAGTLIAGGLACPGLHPGQETAAWFWNHQVAAVAADNPAVEAQPISRDEGFLHRRALVLLGIPFGELWDLRRLSAVCSELNRYDFFFSSTPMSLPRGAGSPANAHVVF